MKKPVIGYIFYDRSLGKDEKAFIKSARKKNARLILFNVSKNIDLAKLEKNAKKCDIIYNNSAEEFALEIVKTIESMGKEVIEPSEVYYDLEDKWLFSLRCEDEGIPSPETILLSQNLGIAKNQLKKFGYWPVIIKRAYGTMGEFVDKAENLSHAKRIIKKFWRARRERIPIIAQEFIRSNCYRVTVIGKKIVQTAIKNNKRWKATGVYEKKFEKFDVNIKLKKLVRKVIEATGMKICGIDLLKRDGTWLVLEINAEPALDFFEEERELLAGWIIDFLVKEIRRIKRLKKRN